MTRPEPCPVAAKLAQCGVAPDPIRAARAGIDYANTCSQVRLLPGAVRVKRAGSSVGERNPLAALLRVRDPLQHCPRWLDSARTRMVLLGASREIACPTTWARSG